jgi:hypothetical protein
VVLNVASFFSSFLLPLRIRLLWIKNNTFFSRKPR